MAKMNPALKWTLISLPIIIGGYFILKATGIIGKKKGKDKKQGDPENGVISSDGGGVKPVVQQYFPLKKGSRGEKVYELQQAILSVDPTALPKFGADKDYGAETENAVVKLLGKKTVDSQDDIAQILKVKGTQEAAKKAAQVEAGRKALADTLINAWKKKNLSFVTDHKVQYDVYQIEAGTGRLIKKETKIANADENIAPALFIKDVTSDSGGFLKIKVGDNVQINISPYGVYLK